MDIEKNSEDKEQENDEGKNDSNSQALILYEDKRETNEDDNKENEENKVYNDVNYWHVEIINDINDDILKELE